MKQILRYSLMSVFAFLFGNTFAQEVTFDFSDENNPWGFPTEQLQETGEFTYDGKTIVVTTSNYTRWFSDTKVLLFGKKDASITLPAFDFDVERIDVVGASGASGKVTFNIFVGDEAVSTEVTGAKGTAEFVIAEGKQAAGTVYVIKNTNDNNNQVSKILIWKKGEVPSGGEEVHIANTAETAYTVAKAIELIDAGEALTEEVYVKGKISQLDKFNSDGSITYWISDDGTTTNQFECYKGKGLEGASFTSIEDLKKGSTVIVKGLLTKYNSTYELNAGNTLVSYDESTAVEEQHIANTAETAYTVAEAIELINAGNSLQETVYVKGIVSQVTQYKDNYKSIDYWISDDGTTESAQFECYSGKGLDGADFESIDDIKVGATVIVKGVMKKYGDIYEFDKNNELVSYEYVANTWTVAGTFPLVDNSWDPSDESADMTSRDDVNFIYVKENIVLEKGTEYKFKVVKNHSWDEAYPGSDYIVTVDETAIYTVTITFNASTKEVGFDKVKTGSASAIEHTYGLVGTLVGSWDEDVEMTKDNDGIYVAVVNNVAAGNYEFKVRADKAWDISYPSNNYELTVDQDNSTVTVTFNEETKEVNATVDSATGISTAKIVNMNNAQIFNLAGQRVEKVTKGIYIQNGKKFIVK